MTLPQKILAAINEAIGPADEFVLLHRPFLPPTAWEYIKECLDTGWVSSAGSYVTRFEETLAQTTGCHRAVATVNGTAALEICFRLAGVEQGDEVICPSLTFVATANAISHVGATPHFVDVSENRLSICPDALAQRLEQIAAPKSAQNGQATVNRETGKRISALCLMHCFGHPAAISEIQAICERYNITLVEDAAESLGSFYKGQHTGRIGKLSAVSFNGNKILTTGGGGAILTDDSELADRAKHLTTTAKVPHAWEFEHDMVGWNFRMPNINAALGLAQLECLPQLLEAKRKLAEQYQRSFASVDDASLVLEPEDSRSNHWLNCILLREDDLAKRDAVLKLLNDSQFQCRPLWQPMHKLRMFGECPRGDLPNTESLCRRAINIPSSADLANNWSALCPTAVN